ncbi:MAG TPA: TonB-dependent receptor [Polyangia bacterium]|jgi:hypothetical protein
MKTSQSMSRLARRSIWTVAALAAVILFGAGTAFAQETTGRIVGAVTDETTHATLAGVTVVLQGKQGEDATLTDDHGNYEFVNLGIGTYAVRFYNATSSSNVVRDDLTVSAGATLRVNAAIPSQEAVQETYVIQKKAAAVDVGSGRLGLTIGEDYMANLPLDRTFGDLVLKAPGAFLESSGDVSIAGASGLENVYMLDGLNVTGMEYGDIMSKKSDASGGSNLTLDFIKELQISTGGYRAEFGGAMGGVVNVVTKSGTNEFHGSAFSYWTPYWLTGDPKRVVQTGSILTGTDKPDYDTNIGVEVGGPIIKNKLFFWLGFAPRLEKSHYFRDVTPLLEDASTGGAAADQSGAPTVLRTRTNELRQSYQYGAKVDFVPAPDHKLTLSLFGTPTASKHVRAFAGEEADNDPMWAVQSLHKNNTDVSANWMSQFLDHRIRLDVSAGLHRETYSDESPYANLNALNQIETHGASLYDYEKVTGCEPVANANGTTFDPCPVGGNPTGYHTGGYGQVKSFTGDRWMADIKLTSLFNRNELKVGAHAELNTFDQSRYYSGPLGERSLIQIFPGYGVLAPWTFFTLPRGTYASQFDPNRGGDPTPLSDPNGKYYQNQLNANVKSVNTAYFIQDSIHPLPNITVDLGLRYENQRMYDFRDTEFLDLANLGPRIGIVYDPSNEGQTKLFANYGQFYETVPMNLAARYFGGEGIVQPAYGIASCNPPVGQWKGTGGEWNGCSQVATFFANAGAPYPVQQNIKGQYHNEIIAGAQHALTPDLVVGVNYTHRWLGSIIEDVGADANFQETLTNPGNVPQSALDSVQNDITAHTATLGGTVDPAQKAIVQAQIDSLKTELNALKTAGQEPKAERTYDALTFTAAKRLAKRWLFQGSYTYSRLIGNYNGLYDADNSYFAPNGGNAYDSPDLVLNKRGPLANDRPHSGHLDAAYQLPTRVGVVTFGISFSAYSGVPRNYVAAVEQGQQLVFLLPRGSAGRTPTVTQADLKISYRRELTKTTAVEAFFNLFNAYDNRTALLMDDNYTLDTAGAIVNGTPADLKTAKNAAGLPIQKNPNFGQPIAYQAPIHGQMGLRLIF